MRRAARTDGNQKKIVSALRAAGERVHVTSGLGGGFPDLVTWSRRAGLKLLEVKDGDKPPSGRKLTPAEALFARLFPVEVVIDVPTAFAAVGL